MGAVLVAMVIVYRRQAEGGNSLVSSQFSPNILCKVTSEEESGGENFQAAENPDMDNPDAILVAPPEAKKEVIVTEEYDSGEELVLETVEPDTNGSDVEEIPKTTVVEINPVPRNIDGPPI